jgi:hypothetical protein
MEAGSSIGGFPADEDQAHERAALQGVGAHKTTQVRLSKNKSIL